MNVNKSVVGVIASCLKSDINNNIDVQGSLQGLIALSESCHAGRVGTEEVRNTVQTQLKDRISETFYGKKMPPLRKFVKICLKWLSTIGYKCEQALRRSAFLRVLSFLILNLLLHVIAFYLCKESKISSGFWCSLLDKVSVVPTVFCTLEVLHALRG